ncbi:hypothetical protein BGZ63DRAFT_373357 [Mariannaea sp. PMI_226]|nr:hypothetical protein BGZ63DRAFT_373357 [Mariannaea sp. PMI_226]
MVLFKTLILAATAVGLAQAGPCKPLTTSTAPAATTTSAVATSTTSTAPPAATTTACVKGLKDNLPADKCGLTGIITSNNVFLGRGPPPSDGLNACFDACAEIPACGAIDYLSGWYCFLYGVGNPIATDGQPEQGTGTTYDMSCYNSCSGTVTY